MKANKKMKDVTGMRAVMTRLLTSLLLLGLVACSSDAPPPARGAPAARLDPVAMVVAIRLASAGDDELFVQPVRDPRVDELRARAEVLEAHGDYKAAAAAIESALAITPGDNELLQWRAEISLLRRKWVEAERQANEAYEKGTKLGGLCRRSWSTIRYSREARGMTDAAEVARRQAEACAVPLPVRM